LYSFLLPPFSKLARSNRSIVFSRSRVILFNGGFQINPVLFGAVT
jgi:hypothetical protein